MNNSTTKHSKFQQGRISSTCSYLTSGNPYSDETSAIGLVATEQPQPMTPMMVGNGTSTLDKNSWIEVVCSH